MNSNQIFQAAISELKNIKSHKHIVSSSSPVPRQPRRGRLDQKVDTFYSKVLDLLCNKLAVASLLDVGCDSPGLIKSAQARGCAPVSISCAGDDVASKDVLVHDFTLGACEAIADRQFDLGVSTNLATQLHEHVVHNYMDALEKCNNVLFIRRHPDQAISADVNMQHNDYWLAQFASCGLKLHRRATDEMRGLAIEQQVEFHPDCVLFFIKL